ncbi:hypothetical protein OGAPHI_004207 [Ogataea philodendri]|uniref:Secreted protein n=1 Tax=Ogataea philodendri TaxID=1378263 RepID=A0A9P8T4J6_9ASCO|nr:uncharacterized protein OGAPHI_004207 [Ogataea philodendri]KAH3666018.1 hypothetical protein OGAPHI_004207 [Ogataea philodendri]
MRLSTIVMWLVGALPFAIAWDLLLRDGTPNTDALNVARCLLFNWMPGETLVVSDTRSFCFPENCSTLSLFTNTTRTDPRPYRKLLSWCFNKYANGISLTHYKGADFPEDTDLVGSLSGVVFGAVALPPICQPRKIIDESNAHPVSPGQCRVQGDFSTSNTCPWIVETKILVQRVDLLDLLLGQIEVVDIKVLDQSLPLVGLRNHQDVSLGGPSQKDLGSRDIVCLGNGVDHFVFKQRNVLGGLLMVQLHKRLRTKRGVPNNGNALVLDPFDQFLLSQVWVVLNLEQLRLDLGTSEQVKNQCAGEVGNTNRLDQSFLNQSLQGLPGGCQRNVFELPAIATAVESWRILLLKRNKLLSNWEVDVKDVQVVQLQVVKHLLHGLLDVVWVVVTVPKLRNNEQFLSLDQSVLNCPVNTLANLFFVAVVHGTVKQTVTNLDGLIDLIRADGLLHLPAAESDSWHTNSVVELDKFRSHVKKNNFAESLKLGCFRHEFPTLYMQRKVAICASVKILATIKLPRC